jgi:hypothetical protein
MQFALERLQRMECDKAQLEAELKPYKAGVMFLGRHPRSRANEERIRVIEREIATVNHFLQAAIRDASRVESWLQRR